MRLLILIQISAVCAIRMDLYLSALSTNEKGCGLDIGFPCRLVHLQYYGFAFIKADVLMFSFFANNDIFEDHSAL